jgi:aminocarboxymuconate-semialdehyde decarboxylase
MAVRSLGLLVRARNERPRAGAALVPRLRSVPRFSPSCNRLNPYGPIMKIDVHNHVVPRSVLNLLRQDPSYGVNFAEGAMRCTGFEFPLTASFHEPEAKLEELAAHRLDAAVVSMAPPAFLYEAGSYKSEALCETANEGMARFAEAQPSRFRWMAHLPMRFPDAAADMLRRARAAGAVGVQVGTNLAANRLDEPMFDPFWSAIDDTRLPVMIHPSYNAPYPGLSDWYLQNVIGNPLETMIAACRLICAGTFDRFPNANVLLAHGGGHLPYQLGRLRHAAAVRRELADAPKDPWLYIGRIKFDCLTHDAQALAYLVDRMGLGNVVLGTDLPFDMASPDPVSMLTQAIGEAGARQVQETNASSLFNFE